MKRIYSFSASLILGMLVIANISAQEFLYEINLGAHEAYEMIYNWDENYFTNEEGERLTRFSEPGRNSPSAPWGSGSGYATASYRPLPHGINVRWFSVVENQFWEGTYQFDQSLINNIRQQPIAHIFHKPEEIAAGHRGLFFRFTEFTVYVVPGGLVTVWVFSNGRQYLLAQFQAERVQEKRWSAFARASTSTAMGSPYLPEFINHVISRPPSRKKYIQWRFSRNLMMTEQVAQNKAAGMPTYHSEPWKRMMQKHAWRLSVNDYFELGDYGVRHFSGELFYNLASDDQLALDARSIPYSISFYIKEKESGTLRRIDITFDQEEIISGFENLATTISSDEPINLHLHVDPDLSAIYAYLIKEDTKLELVKIKGATQNLYLSIYHEWRPRISPSIESL